jgi:large subunit ribosomal protein L18
MGTTTAVLARERRHTRVRKKVAGTSDRPRLNVFRSATHIYAQVIDDIAGHTLAAASDTDKDLAKDIAGKSKTERAALVARRGRAREGRGRLARCLRPRRIQVPRACEGSADAARESGLGF